LNLGYNVIDNGVNVNNSNVCMYIYHRDNIGETSVDMGAGSAGGVVILVLFSKDTDGTMYGSAFDSFQIDRAAGTSVGFKAIRRIPETQNRELYIDTNFTTDVRAAGGAFAVNVYGCAFNSDGVAILFSTKEQCVFALAAFIDIDNANSALKNFFIARGVDV
jgi:hypothetical protein